MPCFCFGITSDCSFGGYNAHQLDIKNVDDLILTDKWGRPSTFEKGIELMIASFRTIGPTIHDLSLQNHFRDEKSRNILVIDPIHSLLAVRFILRESRK